LGYTHGDLSVELQRTGERTPPRVHLDIDTDDVEAEVQRSEGSARNASSSRATSGR
jgi:hypothetical protein